MNKKLTPEEAARALQTIVHVMEELGWYLPVIYATDGDHILRSNFPGWDAERLEKVIEENETLGEFLLGDGGTIY